MHTSQQLGGALLLRSEGVVPPHLPAKCGKYAKMIISFAAKLNRPPANVRSKKAMPGGAKNLLMRLYKRHYYTNVGLLLFAEDLLKLLRIVYTLELV